MKILKTEIPVDDRWHDVQIGDIVHVGHQNFGVVTIWWWKDIPGQPRELPTRRFPVYGTGYEVPTFDPVIDGSRSPVHVGTVVDLGTKLDWHLIEDVL